MDIEKAKRRYARSYIHHPNMTDTIDFGCAIPFMRDVPPELFAEIEYLQSENSKLRAIIKGDEMNKKEKLQELRHKIRVMDADGYSERQLLLFIAELLVIIIDEIALTDD